MTDIKNMKKVDKTLSVDNRIKFLTYCAELYETSGNSPISDSEYDVEYYELEQLVPNDPFFDKVGGIDQQHIYGTPVKHDVTMGSLSKSLDIPSFLKWIQSAYNSNTKMSFVIQHKIDGTSLGCHYKDGKLVKVLSRGDGITGIDVTENAKMVSGILHAIPFKGVVEVRGECHKNRQEFYKKWHTSVGGNYKNPRNFTAGIMNSKDPKEVEEAGLSFICYEAVQMDFDTEYEKNQFLEKQGFNTLNTSTKRTKFGITLEQVAKAVEIYMNGIDRANLPYDIDGVVLKLDDIKSAKKMGSTSDGRKPKSNRAVKFPPSKKETILKGVLAQVGRTGVIKPVGLLEPVDLDGAMIQKATLHNYGSLVGKDAIKIGSVVVIAKKGDIIPQILSVKKQGNKDIDIPTECPACGEKLAWDDNHVDLVCNNYNCVAQLSKKIDYWFKTIGVKGFGGGTIARLVDPDILIWDGKPIISELVEMYYMLDNDRATEHPFRKYSYLKTQLGEKTYDNLLESIKSIKEISLPTFIKALGIANISTSSKDIADIAPTVDDIDKLTVDDLLKMEDFGPAKANSFISAWKDRRDEIRRILKYVEIKKQSQSSDKLKGKKFCFTGSFSSPTRDEMEKSVPENGGKIGSVSKDLTGLVWDGETMKGKYEKAKSLGIPIITQDEFLKLLK